MNSSPGNIFSQPVMLSGAKFGVVFSTGCAGPVTATAQTSAADAAHNVPDAANRHRALPHIAVLAIEASLQFEK
jgi:hypothetical protein